MRWMLIPGSLRLTADLRYAVARAAATDDSRCGARVDQDNCEADVRVHPLRAVDRLTTETP